MGYDGSHLSGFHLSNCEPETSAEKVLRYLQPLGSDQEFDYDEPQWYCREQFIQESGKQTLDAENRHGCPPHLQGDNGGGHLNGAFPKSPWDDLEDSTVEATPNLKVNIVPIRASTRGNQTKEYSFPKRLPRVRGQFSSSNKQSLSHNKPCNDYNRHDSAPKSPRIHESYEPRSPVAPADVRFSWDFSESSELHVTPPFSAEPFIKTKSKLKQRRPSLTESLPVVLAKFPAKNADLDILDSNLIISTKLRSSKSVFSSTNFLSQSLRRSLEFVNEDRDLNSETEHSIQTIHKLILPVSTLPTPCPSSIGPLPQSFGTAKCFQRFMPDSERETFNVQHAHLSMHSERSRMSVMKALINQLIKANGSASAKTIAERIMLMQTSTLSQGSNPNLGSKFGLNLLTVKGLLVEREVELFVTLDSITALFPKDKQNTHSHSNLPLLAACIGNGPSSIGLGMILFFGWFNPSIEVHVDGFGPNLDWETVAESISFPGVGMYECKGLNRLICSKDSLKEYEVVVLSHVLVEFMNGKKANDWANFWLRLHESTRDDVSIVIIDCLKNQRDFMHPHSVMNMKWECVLIGKQQSDVFQTRNHVQNRQLERFQHSQDDAQKMFRMFIAWKVT